jgi:UDP-N-acetylmuramate dehydrogenase
MEELLKTLPEVKGQYRTNVQLSKSTWFRVGGNAATLFKPHDPDDLSHFLKNIDKNTTIHILGLGSNVIIRDNGVEGVSIRLGKNFTNTHVHGDTVTLGCANTDYNIAHYLASQKLSGLEFLVGIPGCLGGAIAMNSGCYGGEIADHLVSIEAIERKTGALCILSKKDLNLKYRHCPLKEEFIFTNATFKLQIMKSQDRIKDRLREITESRNMSQPVRERTGGSTFKNPPGEKAWELIDKAGLRGMVLGGAKVSEKHCNFLINTGDATASDIESLGDLVQKKVFDNSGIKLEWEIIRIGEK